jgi:NAD(P)-dependent dehydrogenase (short-subunit alcohol dehydrogenase family)
MIENSVHTSLLGKVVIVTGAGQGIGALIAKTLAGAGAQVVINDINPDRAERTAAAIRQTGGEAMGIMADISNKFQCSHLIDSTRREWGQVDILVNNAAIKPGSSILKTDEFEWQRVMDVNLKGTFFMSQLVGRIMADRNQADENQEPGGVIINIASKAGAAGPLANHAAYAASKAGVVGFTRECAREFAEWGIRVHAVVADEPADVTAVAHTILTLCTDPNSPIIL